MAATIRRWSIRALTPLPHHSQLLLRNDSLRTRPLSGCEQVRMLVGACRCGKGFERDFEDGYVLGGGHGVSLGNYILDSLGG